MLIRILSHRGYDGINSKLIQNSLEALLVASDFSEFSGIEFDVRQTSDGVLVLSHDNNLGKVTPVEWHIHKKVNEMTYEELKQYQVSIRHGYEKFYMISRFLNPFDGPYITNHIWEKMNNTSTISSLNDLFFDLVLKGYPGECLFEIKDTSVKALLAMEKKINEYKDELDIRIHGRNKEAVEELGVATGVPYGYIVDPHQTNRLTSREIENSSAAFYSISRIQFFDLSPETELLGIKNLVDNGKGINMWTVNSLPQLANILWYLRANKRRYNIVPDEITLISDFPTLIYQYLNDTNTEGLLLNKVHNYFNELDGTLEPSKIMTHKHPLQETKSHI